MDRNSTEGLGHILFLRSVTEQKSTIGQDEQTVISADSINGLSAVTADTCTPYFLPVIRKNSSYVPEQRKKFCGSQNKPTFSSKVISNTYIALYKNLQTGSQKGWQGHFFLFGHITDRRTTWKKKALTKAERTRGLQLCERLNKALKNKKKTGKIPLQTYNPKETNIREQGNSMQLSILDFPVLCI